MNQQGGLTPKQKDLKKAKNADLITLPENIQGTNCFNCKFIKKNGLHLGHCTHPKVDQEVTNRMCCALWDQQGSIRAWE